MKNLFIVSVALVIFSGTFTSVLAQKSVNTLRFTDGITEKKSPVFIEGIEILPESLVSRNTVPIVPSRTFSKPPKHTVRDISSTIESCTPLQFKYAQILNMDVEALGNLALYSFIEEWWGTHYRYGGTTRSGIDCSALAGAVLNHVFGIATPRTARAMYDISEKISRNNLKEGDLVFFNTRGGVSHVGVFLGNGYFTHASTKKGVTINNLDENYYSSKYITGGRLKPVCIQ